MIRSPETLRQLPPAPLVKLFEEFKPSMNEHTQLPPKDADEFINYQRANGFVDPDKAIAAMHEKQWLSTAERTLARYEGPIKIVNSTFDIGGRNFVEDMNRWSAERAALFSGGRYDPKYYFKAKSLTYMRSRAALILRDTQQVRIATNPEYPHRALYHSLPEETKNFLTGELLEVDREKTGRTQKLLFVRDGLRPMTREEIAAYEERLEVLVLPESVLLQDKVLQPSPASQTQR